MDLQLSPRERVRFFDPLQHYQALSSAAAEALVQGNLLKALAFADRRCRIPPAIVADDYVLRAEALHRLGHVEAALKDVALALDRDPENLPANRRMLAWGQDERRRKAADVIARLDTSPTRL